MSLTTNPNDPELGKGVDAKPIEQHKKYLVLSPEELAKGFIKPVRTKYIHKTCGTETTMHQTIAETYAREPWFYGATYCCHCNVHAPVGDFNWSDDGEVVGSS